MKTYNILLTALLFLYCTPLSAQYISESFIKNYPQIAASEGLKGETPDQRNPDEYRVIATRIDRWDIALEEWYHFDSTETTYFESGLIAEWLSMRWDNGILENNWRASYQFNDYDQLLSYVRESWTGEAWGFMDGDFRELATYEADNETSYLSSFWSQGDWRDSYSRTTSYYSGTNLPDTVLLRADFDGEIGLENYERRSFAEYNQDGEGLIWYIENWDQYEFEWAPPYRYQNTYNEDGKRVLQEVFSFSTGSWEPYAQRIFTYNNDGLIIEDRRLLWLSDEQDWREERLFTFEYDANGNQILYESSSYSTQENALELNFRALYEYDEDDNLIAYTVLTSYATGQLENLASFEFTYYDDIGEQATELYKQWNFETEEWENSQYLIFYYNLFPVSDTEDIVAEQATFSLSPNPATDVVRISFNTENLWKDGVLVQLINANGAVEKVFNVQEPNALLDIKGVAAGMYWIKLDNGEQSSSKPIIIK